MGNKTKDLRLVLEIHPQLRAKINPGEDVLGSLTKGLTRVVEDIQTIQELDIPKDAVEEAGTSNTEVRQVRIYGIYNKLLKKWNYLVSYETIRGRELGQCREYSSDHLKDVRKRVI